MSTEEYLIIGLGIWATGATFLWFGWMSLYRSADRRAEAYRIECEKLLNCLKNLRP